MPRVSEQYTAKKRAQILDAARRVCASKPVYSVTMRDIVLESGMSQGGVYSYFANIDEVFAALLLQDGRRVRLEAAVRACLEGASDPAQAVRSALWRVGESLEEAIRGDGKILFELATLYSNEPARFLQIREQLSQSMSREALWRQLGGFIEERAAALEFHPLIPVSTLLCLIETSVDGMAQQALMADRLAVITGGPAGLEVRQRVDQLAAAVLVLLGAAGEGQGEGQGQS